MRVLHWYPNFLGGGGVANAVLGLARAQARVGATVAIASAVANGQPLYQEMDPGPEVSILKWQPMWRVGLGSLVWRGLSRKTRARLRDFKPDIVHVHGEFNPDNLWIPRLFDCPLVLSPHGAFHPVVLHKGRRWGKEWYLRLARRLLYRRVSAFHALCPAEAEHIRAVMPKAKVYCLPQGPSVYVAEGGESSLPVLRNSQVVFIFVGRLDVYTKGLDLLLQAFARALQEAPHLAMALTLVGPDWKGGQELLEGLAKELGCASAMKWTGGLPGEAVRQEMLHSDVYIHLSRHEGFPLAIVEALLLGKPAILSREIGTTSFSEIRSLPHVRVVAPDVEEAAQAMLEFARRREELKGLAQEHLPKLREFFSWERVAKAHLETYGRLCS